MTEIGFKLIMDFEGLPKNNPLDAYWDSYGRVWTIGYGATHYLDGSPVKKGDKLKSKEEAVELLRMMVKSYEDSMYKLVKVSINPYQADALTSFCYNCGVGNLKKSTLLKKVNTNPLDLTIRDEFAKWNKSNGEVLLGLTRRRKAEADLYFTEYIPEEPVVNENEADQTVPGPQIIEVVDPEPTPEPVEPVQEVTDKKENPGCCNILGWFRTKN